MPARPSRTAVFGSNEAGTAPNVSKLFVNLPRLLTFERSSNRTGRESFVGMDALRLFAAVMIVVYHAHSIASKNAAHQGIRIFTEPTWWYACIDLFFVMSGFLMVHMGRPLYGSPRGALVFASRRLIRIPPLFWLYTIVFSIAWRLMPALPGSTPISFVRVAENLLFVPDAHPAIILVAWTIYFEMFFYVIFGLTLMLSFRHGPWAAIAVLVSLTVVGLLPGAAQSRFEIWTDPFLLDFCLGIGVAVLFFRGATLHPFGRLVLILIALLALAALPELGSRNFLRVATYGLSAACAVAVATWRNGDTLPERWSKLIRVACAGTYSLYLFHITVLKLFEAIYFRLVSGPAACYGYIVIGCVLSLFGGWFAYRFVERPLTRLLKPLALRM